jgi:hypothetical protein
MKFRKLFFLERKGRNFKCKVYINSMNTLCANVYEKSKKFWKKRAEYTVAPEDYDTAYQVAESALNDYLLSEIEKRNAEFREKLFWGLDK